MNITCSGLTSSCSLYIVHCSVNLSQASLARDEFLPAEHLDERRSGGASALQQPQAALEPLYLCWRLGACAIGGPVLVCIACSGCRLIALVQ